MAVLCVGCVCACDVSACMCNWWGVMVEVAGVNLGVCVQLICELCLVVVGNCEFIFIVY